jgi:hypothetical protein
VTPIEAEAVQAGKGTAALVVFVASIGLALSACRCPSACWRAVAMVLLGIVPLDAAYCAVAGARCSDRGADPLGTAMEKTGAAALIAQGSAARSWAARRCSCCWPSRS